MEIRGKFGENWCILQKIGGNSGKIGEFRGKSGEIGGNWGKIGELCFPNGETEFTDCEINFPHIRENERKLCVKQVGEMKGNFVFTTSFNCTVLYLVINLFNPLFVVCTSLI